jgi:adenosylcobyric acid synthase
VSAQCVMVLGTHSGAGKSWLATALCRWYARQGLKVAPFKAQNMSNNARVVPAAGGAMGEIGSAQYFQALAAGAAPEVRMNPVLLKPEHDTHSQVVVLGQVDAALTAMPWRERSAVVWPRVQAALDALRAENDVVVIEGAGSPAEINLRATDIANMGLARAAQLPVLVVGDINPGGVFAALFGTLALLSPEDQALVAGFVVNKFRGDPALLEPGLDMLRQLTGRSVLGTIPWLDGLWLDAEDSLSYSAEGTIGRAAPPVGTDWLRVVVPRLPRMSNVTDLDAMAAEPGVQVRLVRHPSALTGADLVVLPGTKSTVDDLGWLRETGLADAVVAHAAAGGAVLGICGGYQMLAERIHDEVESRVGEAPGLNLLPLRIAFESDKTLARVAGSAYGGLPVAGYEIHHGREAWRDPALQPLLRLPGGGGEGARRGAVYGTHWHGAFESDEFRRAFLTEVAAHAGRRGFHTAPDTDYAAVRLSALDILGDAVEEHLDTAALLRLVEGGPPNGLPFIPPGAPVRAHDTLTRRTT